MQLRVRKTEPVERSKTRVSIVQAVTSHVRFQNGNIEKKIREASSFKKRLRFFRQFFSEMIIFWEKK